MESAQETGEIKEENNVTGRLILASISSWLVDKPVNTKIRGSQREVKAVANALIASKIFQEELRRPGVTVESVSQKLRLKHDAVSEFEKVFGVRWPL